MGGNNSFIESCYYGVPMLVFPMSVDQFIIANAVEKYHLGVWLKENQINVNDLGTIISSFIHNRSFHESIHKVQKELKKHDAVHEACKEIMLFANNYK